jgi:hypothetical protein
MPLCTVVTEWRRTLTTWPTSSDCSTSISKILFCDSISFSCDLSNSMNIASIFMPISGFIVDANKRFGMNPAPHACSCRSQAFGATSGLRLQKPYHIAHQFPMQIDAPSVVPSCDARGKHRHDYLHWHLLGSLNGEMGKSGNGQLCRTARNFATCHRIN